SPFARPSIVRIAFLSALEMGVRQEGTALPFTNTVQARHWPSPHPNFVPVKARSSRRTSSNGRCGSVVMVRDCPLILKVIVASIVQGPAAPVGQAAAQAA